MVFDKYLYIKIIISCIISIKFFIVFNFSFFIKKCLIKELDSFEFEFNFFIYKNILR